MQSTLSPDEAFSRRDAEERWEQALKRYHEQTGRNLLDESFARDLLSQVATDHVMKKLEQFATFRNRGHKLLRVLKPMVTVVLRFVDAGAEGASNVAPGGKAIFVAFGALLQAMKGVSQLYDAVESLLQEVANYVERVGIHLEPPTMPNPAVMRLLLDTLVQLLDVLAIITKYCDRAVERRSWSRMSGGAVSLRTMDYFRVMIGKTDVPDALKKLEELAKAEVQMTVAHTNAIARELQPRVKFVYEVAVESALRSWLRPPNQEPVNWDKKRQVGSCKWFFDAQFDDWKARRNGVYWAHGNAGSGKSVLSSSVIDTLKNDPTLFLFYFYFDFSDLAKQDCRALASSLVFQLGLCSEECLKYLLGKRSSDTPTYERLLAMLFELLSLSGRTFIVIDALDECPAPARDNGISSLIKHLFNSDSDRIDLHLFVTSRLEADIQDRMTPVLSHSINLHVAPQHQRELSCYITAQLERKEYRWSPEVKARVHKALMEASNGMFLWVILQLPRLRGCIGFNEIELALKELPSDLNTAYARILEKANLSQASIERARRVFECVASAKRPLFVAEAIEVYYMDLEYRTQTSVDIEDPETFLLERCPGLLCIIDYDDLFTDGTLFGHIGQHGQRYYRALQFVHFSAKEYLASPQVMQSTSLVHQYSFNAYSANLTLAKVCLLVLEVGHSLSNLSVYAGKYWRTHVSARNEDDLSELLDHFLCMSSTSFARWSQYPEYRISYDESLLPIHCAARLGLCHCVERMLKKPPPQDSASSTDTLVKLRTNKGLTPLWYAALSGDVEMCRLLLDHGALNNDITNEGAFVLSRAVIEGYLDIVSLLLQYQADDKAGFVALCRAHTYYGQTALRIATTFGRTEIARLLLNSGAPLDDTDDEGQTALHIAVSGGHIDIVRLLLNYGALVDVITDKIRQSPLHFAAGGNHIEIVRLLLNHGALVDVVDENDSTPLFLAVVWRNPEVARILLDQRAKHTAQAPLPGRRVLNYNLQLNAEADTADGLWRAIIEDFASQLEAPPGEFDTLVSSSSTVSVSSSTHLSEGLDGDELIEDEDDMNEN